MDWVAVAGGLAEAVGPGALPLLHSVADSEGYLAPGCALAGWAAGAYVHWLGQARDRPPRREDGVWTTLERGVDIASALAQVLFGAALLFRQAARWDPLLGAGLCAIPLFHAVCLTAPVPAARYERGLSVCVAAAAALALILGAVWALSDDAGERRFEPASGSDFFLLIANGVFGAYEASAPGLAGGALVALCLWTPPIRGLLRRRQSGVLLVVAGLLTVLSTRRQALRVRQLLGAMPRPAGGGARWFSKPQRALMLMVAPALTLGYSFRWGDWRGGSWVGVAVLAGRLAVYVWG